MLDKLKKYFRFLISGSFALIIAACYGMPVDYDYDTKSFRAKDDNEEPIPDLQLSLQEVTTNAVGATNTNTLNMGLSDYDGTVSFSQEDWTGDYFVNIQDIDGNTNGSWKSTNIMVEEYEYHTEIVMQSAE